jgi:hypothetical protein
MTLLKTHCYNTFMTPYCTHLSHELGIIRLPHQHVVPYTAAHHPRRLSNVSNACSMLLLLPLLLPPLVWQCCRA